MTEQNPNPVVVAVGHDPVDAALAFAGEEAGRAGCGLHLVHVVHRVPQAAETPLVAESDLERSGRLALDAALERAGDLVAADMTVTSELRFGRVVPTLVDVAVQARMIVLEHRALSALRRVVTRSVSSGVAAHARVPTVAVPSSWSPSDAGDAPLPVIVGVDVPDRAQQVLRMAVAEARGRGVGLRVLHTWNLPTPYEDLARARSEDEDWKGRAEREIRAVLDTLGDAAAGVPVEIVVRHNRAADALVEASGGASLLVIGRHDPLIPIGSHLGPVARAVLREAACPILLADPRPSRLVHRHPQSTDLPTGRLA